MASGSGRGTDASFYSESFLGFSYNLFLQLKVFTTVSVKTNSRVTATATAAGKRRPAFHSNRFLRAQALGTVSGASATTFL